MMRSRKNAKQSVFDWESGPPIALVASAEAAAIGDKRKFRWIETRITESRIIKQIHFVLVNAFVSSSVPEVNA
jgi:hypothetical protein